MYRTEKCQCQDGWGGSDCAAPICTAAAKLLNFGAAIIEFAGFSRRRLLMASDASPDVVSLSIPISDADRHETSRTGGRCPMLVS